MIHKLRTWGTRMLFGGVVCLLILEYRIWYYLEFDIFNIIIFITMVCFFLSGAILRFVEITLAYKDALKKIDQEKTLHFG